MDTRHADPAQCEICLATFTSKISLYKHHMGNHKTYPLSMDTREFEFCEECGIPCLSKVALKKHLYMHKNKFKWNKSIKKDSKERGTLIFQGSYCLPIKITWQF